MAKLFCEKPVCSSQLKKKQLIFPPTKATATGFSAIRKPLFFGKFFYKVIILKSNVRKQIIIKNTNGYRIISFFVKKQRKKSTCTKQIFIHGIQFPKNPWRLWEDKWPNFDAPLSSLKRFLGRGYFGFKLVTFSQLFSQGLHNRYGKPPFLRSPPNIYPAAENNALFFIQKVFSKGTSPADHSQPCFSSFGCLRIDTLETPISQFLKALGGLLLIIKLSSRSRKSRQTTELLVKISSTSLRSFNFNNCWIVN